MTIAVRVEPRAESERWASSNKAGENSPESQSHEGLAEEPKRMTGDRVEIHQENLERQEKEVITGEKAEAVTAARDHLQAVNETMASQDRAKESSPELQGLREVREDMLLQILKAGDLRAIPEQNPEGQEKEAVSDQKAGGSPKRAARPVVSDIPVREGNLIKAGNLRRGKFGKKGMKERASLLRMQLLFR